MRRRLAREIADELVAAERERKPIAQFSDRHPDLDLATAYRAQQAFVGAKLADGESFVGYSSGSRAGTSSRLWASTRRSTAA